MQAAAASNAGYRLAQLVARLYTDRHPIALFNKDGEPTRDIDWLLRQGYRVAGAELSRKAVNQLFEELEIEPRIYGG